MHLSMLWLLRPDCSSGTLPARAYMKGPLFTAPRGSLRLIDVGAVTTEGSYSKLCATQQPGWVTISRVGEGLKMMSLLDGP